MALESIGALAYLADPPAARAMVEETTVSLGGAPVDGETETECHSVLDGFDGRARRPPRGSSRHDGAP